MPIPKLKEKFTVQDYMTWPDEERWEIIDGIAYDMSPAPNIKHQKMLGNLFARIQSILAGKKCTPFFAPTDVILSEYDVVQPDLLVVCDPAKITEKNIQGAPDLVVEILSPSTSTKDRREKKRLYEKSGVREYVLIDPVGQNAERFFLDEKGQFDRGEIFDDQQSLILKSLENLEVPMWEIFEVEKKPE